MKKVLVLAVIAAFVLVFAAAVLAADVSPAKESSPTTSMLPTLQSSGETTVFQAADQDAAQQICDQVAQKENKTKCSSMRSTPKGEAQERVDVNAFYCVCE
jgi:hypothetical protein